MSELNLCLSGGRELAKESPMSPLSSIWNAFLLALKGKITESCPYLEFVSLYWRALFLLQY